MKSLSLSIFDRDETTRLPNRAERRAMRRAFTRQHRHNTRFWRRAWCGLLSQQEATNIVKALNRASEKERDE
jgi:hypothetical protein